MTKITASILQVAIEIHKTNRGMTFGYEIGPDSEDEPVVKQIFQFYKLQNYYLGSTLTTNGDKSR